MIKKIFFSFLLSFSLVSFAKAESTSKRSHRKNQADQISKIYKLEENIESWISKGELQETVDEFEYCQPGADTLRRVFKDDKNQIVKYVRSGGSDDSSATESFYYDDQEKLRLVIAELGATNGTKVKLRAYFDQDQKLLSKDTKISEGPGYPFPQQEPQYTWDSFDVKKELASKHPCPKIKK